MVDQVSSYRIVRHPLFIPLIIAAAQMILQMIVQGNYGYHRDELYYIACTDHLSFGYVDHPPLSIFLLRATRALAGDGLHAIRFPAALAGAGVILLASMITGRLGGGRFAQALSALAVVAAPALISSGKFFSMNAFDIFFWALNCYLLAVILTTDKKELWVPFGIVSGLGLLNKYSIGFLLIGMALGLLLTRHRRHFTCRWFWLGAAIAGLIVLPHLLWEWRHSFPTLEFMHNASQLKNARIPAWDFLLGQFRDIGFVNVVLLFGGLYLFFSDARRLLQPFGWLYVTVLAILIAGNGKVYYISTVYPLVLAGGAVSLERISARWVRPAFVAASLAMFALSLPFTLPVLPVGQFIAYERFLGMMPAQEERFAPVAELPQYYADEFGWEELADTMASVYGRLTPEEQSNCVLYLRNYGEAGAIDFFGKRHHLPPATCAHNSYWYWGPGDRTGDVAIIVGHTTTLEENLADLRRAYREVTFVTSTHCRYCMPYENGRMIFLCKGMKTTFQAIWPKERFFI